LSRSVFADAEPDNAVMRAISTNATDTDLRRIRTP
jgi:hypothetical protein